MKPSDHGGAALVRRPIARGKAGAVIPASLSFDQVARRFGEREVLRNVSFEVREGEIVCLLGPSGCGKSTLLRIAAGIEDLDSGRILIDDREVQGPERFIVPEQRGVGLVFQDYALFPHLDILDNVCFGLQLSRAEARPVATAALARVGLAHHARSFPHMLSGGEQQRVALARALVPRPRVLLMDEPFSNLDRRMRDGIRDETVALLRETGATAIIVTHDPEEAMRVADRIALMREGRIAQIGTAQELYLEPSDVETARFFSELNELDGIVQAGRIRTALGTFEARGVADGPALACIRPRSMHVVPASSDGLPALLVSLRFIGDAYLAELLVQGVDGPLKARLPEHPGVDPGRVAGLTVAANDVLVFGRAAA